MKFLMLFLGLLSLSIVDEEIAFEEHIAKAYDEYVLLEEHENNYYELKLYAGKVKNKIYYGIYFRNEIPNEYKLKVRLNDRIYVLAKNQRGDVFAPAVDFNKAKQFSLLVYNKDDNYQYGLTKFHNIKVMDLDDFSQLPNVFIGSGNDTAKTKIRTELIIDTRLYIYFAMVAVMLTCACILLVYYKKKKGMFNPELRSANVFNFKKFINSVFEEEPTSNLEKQDMIKEVQVKVEDVKQEEVKEKTVLTTYKWYHYEEEISDFDIISHLKKLNLNPIYKEATLEEKNKIMIELMKLKDQNIITYDDYLNEISKLWKE